MVVKGGPATAMAVTLKSSSSKIHSRISGSFTRRGITFKMKTFLFKTPFIELFVKITANF